MKIGSNSKSRHAEKTQNKHQQYQKISKCENNNTDSTNNHNKAFNQKRTIIRITKVVMKIIMIVVIVMT